jgi:hypothetical protein
VGSPARPAGGAERARCLDRLRGELLAQGGLAELRDAEGGPELWFEPAQARPAPAEAACPAS